MTHFCLFLAYCSFWQFWHYAGKVGLFNVVESDENQTAYYHNAHQYKAKELLCIHKYDLSMISLAQHFDKAYKITYF